MAGKANVRNQKFILARGKNGVIPKARGIIKGDARLKIIQKNRSKLVDARDRLAQMVKKTNARAKILKLQQRRVGGNVLNTDIVRPVGSSILMKTDRNGKISLSTTKAKKTDFNANINSAIRKELRNQRKQNIPPKNQNVRQVQRSNIATSLYRDDQLSVNRYPRDIAMTDGKCATDTNINRYSAALNYQSSHMVTVLGLNL